MKSSDHQTVVHTPLHDDLSLVLVSCSVFDVAECPQAQRHPLLSPLEDWQLFPLGWTFQLVDLHQMSYTLIEPLLIQKRS